MTWQQRVFAAGPIVTLVIAWVCCIGMLATVVVASCSAVKTYGPPVMEAAIRHFQEVLEREQVASDRLKCEVEVHESTALMLCEAKLTSRKP